MTEQPTTDVTTDLEENWLDSWIDGATIARTSVDIYQRPDLFSRYEALERDMKLAQAAEKAEGDERSLDDSRVAEIEAKMVELYEAWMASKSIWHVRALPAEVYVELGRAHPELEPITELAKDATEEQRVEHRAKVKAFSEAATARNYAVLAQCIVQIDFADGRTLKAVLDDRSVMVVKPLVTPAQLDRQREKLGEWQLIKLIAASKKVAASEPVIPAPFSRSSSKTEET